MAQCYHTNTSVLAGTCCSSTAGRGRGEFWAVTRIYISVEQSVLCCVSWAVSIFQLLRSLVMIMNTAGARSASGRIIKSPGGSLHFFMWSLLSLLSSGQLTANQPKISYLQPCSLLSWWCSGGGGTRLTIRRLPKHNWNTSHCQTELSLSEKFQTTTSTLDKKDPDYWNCSMIDRSVVFAGLLSDSIIKRVKLFLMKLITTCCIFCLLQQTFIIIFCESVPSLLCIKTKYLSVMPIPAGQISNNKFLQARLLWCCMGEFSFFIQ